MDSGALDKANLEDELKVLSESFEFLDTPPYLDRSLCYFIRRSVLCSFKFTSSSHQVQARLNEQSDGVDAAGLKQFGAW